ncbi:benzil reductase ((S)-benzoin forming) [Halobacillus karajensis]|uniref:Benzil reductase ((S)-benzoin forming) n=1 Tax=Halobacillus karajensis TaxID=195088 RepID=A0A059NZ61_9BACI|nr:(S)-benzoin forming benzil reductase [Halobacillus karajensis]CDQ21160.1 Benzil reductase ((S)-benzoin forming) [Halobacillus karajensis]CDQ24776.1 Benzil reductase ((S)-benzoin forming) [Halobacillus karajensis]CDQ28864.1 Benzil reductase ((S)-benzoin forming) [Halobacillus karajensis]SEH95478.1 benzil reductase ((S)-benzoin forming) [Halobacillus karajensis]
MQYAIVTGASRGLGEAIARQYILQNVHVIAVSRSGNEELRSLAEKQGVDFHHISCDLSRLDELDKGLDQIAEIAFQKETHYVYLVNNAGVIDPIETVGQLEADAVQKHMQVNVTAPILFVNRCLKEANDLGVSLGIINITSGAAEKTIHGWSTYSSSKAAINRFTETLALEQESKGHTIFAYSPGVMDTDMQGEIRSSSEDSFADVGKFRKLKEEGDLRSPDEVAGVLMNLLKEPKKIENGRVYKLYDLIRK